jgi:hypothetical protein
VVAHPAAPDGELLVELDPASDDRGTLARIEQALADAGLGGLPVRRLDHIPVDGRHNSKVDRRALRRLRRSA